MTKSFIQAIYNKLFTVGGKRFVVAINRDGMLLDDGVRSGLESEMGVVVAGGEELELRIARETVVSENRSMPVLFVARRELKILEDIAAECDVVYFQMKSLFPYTWEKVKSSGFDGMKRFYEEGDYTALQEGALGESKKFEMTKASWDLNLGRLDFNKPTEWMNKAAGTVLSVIEQDRWADFQEEVRDVNEKFNEFLKTGYANVVSSTCGTKYPRIVTQVLPFISLQKYKKVALVVVDGMNYWQALLLLRSLQERLGVKAKVDCIYSWLPSVTELSRQAIFRGGVPSDSYVQSPSNEEKLWKAFWDARRVPQYEMFYQHSGMIAEENSVKKLGYVSVDLDEKMHASEDYMYLYDSTKRWVGSEEVVENFRHLLSKGYKVYITTDHGNVETRAYKRLDSRDKLGADLSNRHITIPDEADKGIFESQYEGHILQVDSTSRTYYAVGNEAFSSEKKMVTHGGTHWLEVLIPFITIE